MTSIIQFADIHFGREDRQALTALAEVVSALRPDVTLICGDITQDGKTAEFRAARDWIRTLEGPKVITPGNHDTPTFGIFQRLFDPFGRYNRIIKPLSEPFYADQYVSIVPLNTARGWQTRLDWSLGVVDMAALSETVDQLGALPPKAVKLVMAHHPFIYPPSSPLQKDTQNGPEGLSRLSALNIDGVLTGHVHVPFMLGRQPGDTDIMSIGAGTLSTRRRNKPASFNHIAIDDTLIKVTAIDWQDGAFSEGLVFTKLVAELKSRRPLKSAS